MNGKKLLETFPFPTSLLWLIIHLSGSVAVDVLDWSIHDDFFQDDVKYTTDDDVANGNYQDDNPCWNRKCT
jgi:hypothetical protein